MASAGVLVENAKIMSKGQVTIPKDVRKALGVESGDRVLFVVEGGMVRMVNAAVYAMEVIQHQMAGAAEESDLTNEAAILEIAKEARKEVAGE